MLTDIFAYRHSSRRIWSQFTDVERRLLNQAFGIAKDALPYYLSNGKVNLTNKPIWETLHNRLARELGVNELSPRFYSFTHKGSPGQESPVSGFFDWVLVCDQFVNEKYVAQRDADSFVKKKSALLN